MYAHGLLAVAVAARSEANACCSVSVSALLAKQQEAILRTQLHFTASASEACPLAACTSAVAAANWSYVQPLLPVTGLQVGHFCQAGSIVALANYHRKDVTERDGGAAGANGQPRRRLQNNSSTGFWTPAVQWTRACSSRQKKKARAQTLKR